jgi:hypothetical protein
MDTLYQCFGLYNEFNRLQMFCLMCYGFMFNNRFVFHFAFLNGFINQNEVLILHP